MTTGGKIAETVAGRMVAMIKAMMAMAQRDMMIEDTAVEDKTIETTEEDVATTKAMVTAIETEDMVVIVAAAATAMSEAQGARPLPVGTQAMVVEDSEDDRPVATTLGTAAADKVEAASAGQQVAPMEAAMAGVVMAEMTLSALVRVTTILGAIPMVEAAWVAPGVPTK